MLRISELQACLQPGSALPQHMLSRDHKHTVCTDNSHFLI
jgi:hypothetical protein